MAIFGITWKDVTNVFKKKVTTSEVKSNQSNQGDPDGHYQSLAEVGKYFKEQGLDESN